MRKVHLLTAGTTLQPQQAAGVMTLTVPTVDVHEVVAIDLEPGEALVPRPYALFARGSRRDASWSVSASFSGYFSATFCRSPGSLRKVVELRHRVVAELGVRLDVHLRAACSARCTSTALRAATARRPARSARSRPAFDVAEQRSQRVDAVGASAAASGCSDERRERREEVDLGDQRVRRRPA